jgi:hypothetical protein
MEPKGVNVRNIPQELRDRDQWVLWRYELRDGKRTKVPYSSSGNMADSTGPETWASFADTLEALSTTPVERKTGAAGEITAKGFEGVGYVFASDDPYTGVDFDACMNDGEMQADAAALVMLLDSYTEISPSGNGVKVIVRASKNGFARCRTDKTPWGDEFECYDQGRYFTFTGDVLRGSPTTIEDRDEQLHRVLTQMFPANGNTTSFVLEEVAAGNSPALSDSEVLEKAFNAANGEQTRAIYSNTDSMNTSSGDQSLVSRLAFYTQDQTQLARLLRGSGRQREKLSRDDYVQRTIASALAGISKTWQPSSRVNDAAEKLKARIAERRQKSGLFAVDAHEFVATKTDVPAVLLGTMEKPLLTESGFGIPYALGGQGKTTLTIDCGVHLASGVNWLGFEVAAPRRVLFIENEGPQEMFRQKLERRLSKWPFKIPEGHLRIHIASWGALSLKDPDTVTRLHDEIDTYGTQVIIGDPLDSLGLDGVGSPEDTRKFMELLATVRGSSHVAFWLPHHSLTHDPDTIAGAWHGRPDSIIGITKLVGNRAQMKFTKARWSQVGDYPTLILEFNPDDESFDVVKEVEQHEDRNLRAEIDAFFEANAWKTATEMSAAIGSRRPDIEQLLEANPDRYEMRTGDAAEDVGRHRNAKIWNRR